MEFQNVSVVGLGTMGHGIAQTLALAGANIRVFDTNHKFLEELHYRISGNLSVMMDAGAIPQVDESEVLKRIVCNNEHTAAAHIPEAGN